MLVRPAHFYVVVGWYKTRVCCQCKTSIHRVVIAIVHYSIEKRRKKKYLKKLPSEIFWRARKRHL
jgi:hypothetical protein